MDTFIVTLSVLGVVVHLTPWLPMVLKRLPLSLPILCLLIGMLLAWSPYPLLPSFNPLESRAFTERMTEVVVIIALMGAGLKLDRPIGLARWRTTWRLLGMRHATDDRRYRGPRLLHPRSRHRVGSIARSERSPRQTLCLQAISRSDHRRPAKRTRCDWICEFISSAGRCRRNRRGASATARGPRPFRFARFCRPRVYRHRSRCPQSRLASPMDCCREHGRW